MLNQGGIFLLGVYGGKDFEGIWDQNFHIPHRFFSFYADEKIKETVTAYSTIINFKAIETGRKYHFQLLILKNI